MLCRMPVVSLPDDLKDQLQQSESGTINNTDGPGVAVYVSSDGRARADIYIGLKLDGLKLYWNISSVKPNIKMKFSVQPNISCDIVSSDLNKDKVITVEVRKGILQLRRICFISRSSRLDSTAQSWTWVRFVKSNPIQSTS